MILLRGLGFLARRSLDDPIRRLLVVQIKVTQMSLRIGRLAALCADGITNVAVFAEDADIVAQRSKRLVTAGIRAVEVAGIQAVETNTFLHSVLLACGTDDGTKRK